MKKSFSRFFAAPLAALILASFALAPVAEARGGGGSFRRCTSSPRLSCHWPCGAVPA